jgi:hypothetical protein
MQGVQTRQTKKAAINILIFLDSGLQVGKLDTKTAKPLALFQSLFHHRDYLA